jgi:hypothetical protein
MRYRTVLQHRVAFLGTLLLILACGNQPVTRSENNGQEKKNKESLRGRLPDLPQRKLSLSQHDSKSAWCDFVSYTLNDMKPDMFLDRAKLSWQNKVLLLVDDRETLGHFWTIPWTLNLLGPEWALQILTKEKSLHFYRGIVQHYGIANAKLDTFEERYGYGPWVQDDFMRRVQYMLASEFWKGIRAEHILVIQENGVPLRRWDSPEVQILFEEIFQYGYAGAPWNLEEDYRPGGNGGFSYRKRSVLSESAIALNVEFRDLLSNTTNLGALGADNEDAVLGNLLASVDFGVAPKYLEHQFACETLYQPKPFGVHHFAPRHSTAETTQLVQLALSEFYGVSDAQQVLELNSSAKRFEWQNSWLKFQKLFPNGNLPLECLDA